MKKVSVKTKKGEAFDLFQADDGLWCCPVCGSPELKEPPYGDMGEPSFEICSCGFEYGYDDNPLATSYAVKGIVENWKRWRAKLVEDSDTDREGFKTMQRNLKNIGIDI